MVGALHELLAANPDEAVFVLVEAVALLRSHGLTVPRHLTTAVDRHLATEHLDQSGRRLAGNAPA